MSSFDNLYPAQYKDTESLSVSPEFGAFRASQGYIYHNSAVARQIAGVDAFDDKLNQTLGKIYNQTLGLDPDNWVGTSLGKLEATVGRGIGYTDEELIASTASMKKGNWYAKPLPDGTNMQEVMRQEMPPANWDEESKKTWLMIKNDPDLMELVGLTDEAERQRRLDNLRTLKTVGEENLARNYAEVTGVFGVGSEFLAQAGAHMATNPIDTASLLLPVAPFRFAQTLKQAPRIAAQNAVIDASILTSVYLPTAYVDEARLIQMGAERWEAEEAWLDSALAAPAGFALRFLSSLGIDATKAIVKGAFRRSGDDIPPDTPPPPPDDRPSPPRSETTLSTGFRFGTVAQEDIVPKVDEKAAPTLATAFRDQVSQGDVVGISIIDEKTNKSVAEMFLSAPDADGYRTVDYIETQIGYRKKGFARSLYQKASETYSIKSGEIINKNIDKIWKKLGATRDEKGVWRLHKRGDSSVTPPLSRDAAELQMRQQVTGDWQVIVRQITNDIETGKTYTLEEAEQVMEAIRAGGDYQYELPLDRVFVKKGENAYVIDSDYAKVEPFVNALAAIIGFGAKIDPELLIEVTARELQRLKRGGGEPGEAVRNSVMIREAIETLIRELVEKGMAKADSGAAVPDRPKPKGEDFSKPELENASKERRKQQQEGYNPDDEGNPRLTQKEIETNNATAEETRIATKQEEGAQRITDRERKIEEKQEQAANSTDEAVRTKAKQEADKLIAEREAETSEIEKLENEEQTVINEIYEERRNIEKVRVGLAEKLKQFVFDRAKTANESKDKEIEVLRGQLAIVDRNEEVAKRNKKLNELMKRRQKIRERKAELGVAEEDAYDVLMRVQRQVSDTDLETRVQAYDGYDLNDPSGAGHAKRAKETGITKEPYDYVRKVGNNPVHSERFVDEAEAQAFKDEFTKEVTAKTDDVEVGAVKNSKDPFASKDAEKIVRTGIYQKDPTTKKPVRVAEDDTYVQRYQDGYDTNGAPKYRVRIVRYIDDFGKTKRDIRELEVTGDHSIYITDEGTVRIQRLVIEKFKPKPVKGTITEAKKKFLDRMKDRDILAKETIYFRRDRKVRGAKQFYLGNAAAEEIDRVVKKLPVGVSTYKGHPAHSGIIPAWSENFIFNDIPRFKSGDEAYRFITGNDVIMRCVRK